MRVLILSAFFACAAAAPSVSVPIASFLPAPTLYQAPIAVPVALPTVSPGDIQAATIDAQVKAEDQARALADQARELAEIAAENQNEGVMEAIDMSKEKADLAFWTAEEEKQRALDAERVAAAQADAKIARSAYIGTPYYDPSVQESAQPIPEQPTSEQPMPEAAGKSAEMPATEATPEAPKEEPIVKMADPQPEAKAEKSDSVQVESAEIKTEPAQMEKKPLPSSVFATLLGDQTYTQPIVPIAYIQPGLQTIASPAIFPGHFVAPQILHTQW